jgi:predicted hydrocarbon binding protein/KaiC/GvpD/RAD55 family RecA-like ATPase
MERRGLSLAEIQEVPKNSLVLLAGPPGTGKSDFCHQVVLNGLAVERPVIVVTTEQGPDGVIGLLREKGMGEVPPGAVSFVDAFTETVGLSCRPRPDAVCANCVDLNSISMATTRLQERIGQRGILLAIDSLTSPYLFNGAEVIKFMRLFLSRFTAQGNSVVALMDEGVGKEEDLVAMMSAADEVIEIEMEEDRRLLNIVKHPKVRPTRIEVPMTPSIGLREFNFDLSMMRQFMQAMLREDEAWMRREVGDFVNLFWPNLAHWSGMLWDPKGFPTMIYEINKEEPHLMLSEYRSVFPWKMRLLLKLAPKGFSKVKEMKKASKLGIPYIKMAHFERSGVVEYLEDLSRADEHYFRVYESSDCFGFENVGATMASHLPPLFAGGCKGIESEESEWNAIETKCIGLGDPYCEFKLVAGEIDGLKDSLEKDVSVIERIHERLMDRLMGFLLQRKPLVERPKLGSDIHIHPIMHAFGFPHVAGERYRMALRMGGARSGKEVGERLINAGLGEDEAVRCVVDFMGYCKVGKITAGETIRIRENCESIRTKLFTAMEEPSCHFTTGFLNGLFSAAKNQHVREIKCIAAGDPYCEWEIM